MQFVGMILGRIFAWALGALAFKLITALGVGVVTYLGLSELLDAALTEIQGLTSGLTTQLSQAIVLMRIDDGVAVIFSAMAARIALRSFGPGGAIGSMFIRPPVAP